LRKVKKHLSGKDVWETHDQGPLSREGAPLIISGAFAVALLWMRIRKRCPIIEVPEVHNKTTKMNRLTLQQPFFENVDLFQTIHSR